MWEPCFFISMCGKSSEKTVNTDFAGLGRLPHISKSSPHLAEREVGQGIMDVEDRHKNTCNPASVPACIFQL